MLEILSFLPTEGSFYLSSRIGVLLAALLVICLITFKIILPIIRKAVTKTRIEWDDLLIKNRFFSRILWIIPIIAGDRLSRLLFDIDGEHVILKSTVSIAITMLVAAVILALINTIRDVFEKTPSLKSIPFDNIRQLAVLVIYLVATIFIVSIIFDKSPLALLTGLSAAMALVLLIFKDVILGFVAGVQLSLNRLVRVGDWIVFNKGGADGTVISVGLTVVKVRNFDKTITSIPVYDLVSNSFTNWRGMQETGARRIKRAIFIDQNSVTYLTEEKYQRFKDHPFMSAYIEEKIASGACIAKPDKLPEQRCLSNLGTFRAYIEKYLDNKKEIRSDMLIMCRQLAPTEHGLPLEIYCFTEVDWKRYEGIQADILDHILCAADYFDLRVHQFGDIQKDRP
ncbi:mechanosensitive ion channel family protein [Gayadomonas joobiniege]|uniref:mechanosensitive ion channel family protein n=1 Tax=Gayadomonas joobiniege TaxID=1234606 RepID=UPI000AA1AC53|nr:mechanosensitive ion channel domain-containing protein [Gayadomonas joobiniege]